MMKKWYQITVPKINLLMKECRVVTEKMWITLDMQDNRKQKHFN